MAAVALTAGLGLLVVPGPAEAGPARAGLPGSLAILPPGARVEAPLPASRVVDADVALALPDPAALSSFVAAVSTPGSPHYRQYLSAHRFAARFGPSAATVGAVRAWLASTGLSLGPTSADGLLVPVHGPAPVVAAAFGTALEAVRLASGAQAYTDTVVPSVPGGLAGAVRGVIGLANVDPWHSDLARAVSKATDLAPGGSGGSTVTRSTADAVTADAASADAATAHAATADAAPQACAAASNFAHRGGPLTFTEAAAAYGMSGLYPQGRIGAGVTVAVYELEPFEQSDIDGFEACYGIDNQVRTVAVDGGAGTGPGSGESALDIEDLAAMAPGADIVVYEGPNNTTTGPIDTLDRIATDDAAQVVSSSWGQCEAENTPTHGGNASVEADIFAEMAAQGQTMLAASGDSGSEDCWEDTIADRDTDTTLAVDDPSSQPDVTGVGGTSLPSPTPSSQDVWNDCQGAPPACAEERFAGASGGGLSSVWTMPAWQAEAGRGTINSFTSGGPCGAPAGTYCREVPDVAADADPATGYPIFWDGQWNVVGGTSAAAPLWAALIALTDQGCAPTKAVGFADPALYRLGAAGSGAFDDVTAGDNDLTDTNAGDYPATAGYDMATGWGTPDGAAALAALQPAGGCPAVEGIDPSSGPLAGGSVVSISGSDLAGATAVHFGSLPATILADTATSVTVVAPAAPYSEVVFVTVTTPNGTSAAVAPSRFAIGNPRNGLGYWEVASDGGLFAFGDAQFYGSMGGRPLAAPVVGVAATPDDHGYWEVASDGGIFAFGDAGFYGSMGGQHLDQPIVGIAPTPTGAGYWEVASDGGIFAFGDAGFYGSMGGRHLDQPIVGIAPTPTGAGYWEVAADGGIFAFGERPVLRLDGRSAPRPAHRGHRRHPHRRRLLGGGQRRRHLRLRRAPSSTARWAARPSTARWSGRRPAPTATATGRWPPTAASSPSATPPSSGPPAGSAWRPRWSVWPSPDPSVAPRRPGAGPCSARGNGGSVRGCSPRTGSCWWRRWWPASPPWWPAPPRWCWWARCAGSSGPSRRCRWRPSRWCTRPARWSTTRRPGWPGWRRCSKTPNR